MPQILTEKELQKLVKEGKLKADILRQRPEPEKQEVDQAKLLAEALAAINETNKHIAVLLKTMVGDSRAQVASLEKGLMNLATAISRIKPALIHMPSEKESQWQFTIYRDVNNLISEIEAKKVSGGG